MMRILSATADKAEWDLLWSKLPVDVRDVHFTSAYARVQEVMGGKAILAVLGNDPVVMQPFLMRPIEGTGFFDLKSFYSFGGPVTNGDLVSAVAIGSAFHNELFNWARQNGVISEYCCLHPMLAYHQLRLVKENVVFAKDTVVIDKLASFEESRCSRRVRRALKKARDGFVVIEVEAPDAFEELYNQSMTRLRAEDRWRFSTVYWHSHGRKEIGARWFFVVQTHGNKDAGRFRRGLLTVGLGPVAYAHFLGSDGELSHDGLDQLLYYSAARHLAEEGFEDFHLGGGLTEDALDSLLLFKRGFSDTRYRVGSYRRIFQRKEYDRLVDERSTSFRSTRFPAYRTELA